MKPWPSQAMTRTCSAGLAKLRAGCPKTIGELRVRRVIGALRQAFKLGIRRSGLPQVQ